MGASNSTPARDEMDIPISFSPDVVNQLELSDTLYVTEPETTPKRQLILDSHIQARIRDEIELLKRDEEDVRCEIERALEKENLDREKSMASKGDGTNSSILWEDLNEIRDRIDKYASRRKGVEVEAVEVVGKAVVECYKYNKETPLVCWSQVRDFKASVERMEQKTVYNRS